MAGFDPPDDTFTPDGCSFLRICYPEIFRARTPVAIYGFTRKNSKWQLSWSGGSGPFRIQECTNMLNAMWQDLGGSMTNRVTEVEPRSDNALYRVVTVAE